MSDATQTEHEFKLPTPGENHALFAAFEGKFKSEVKIWMGPGEPAVSTGVMTNTLQLGGLFLYHDYAGDKSEGPFPNFEGKGFWGYNSVKNIFEGFWIDTVSDQFQMESGQVDESGKCWTMHSEFTCPGVGVMKKRTVITLIDNDHHNMDSFITMDGQPESKSMEIRYTRV